MSELDAAAFHALERGRARSFLSLLAERDLQLPDLPPELAAERRHLDAEYDRVQSQISRLSVGKDDPEISVLKVHVEEAEYWDAPSSAAVRILKRAATGGQSKVGEHEKLVVDDRATNVTAER